MPYHQFTVPTGSASAARKAEIAAAITKAHVDVPGAPAE
jgi:phenylpyruvate tautomerase PptA (4-oxalocrotonate tautomerase family)